MVEMRSTPVVRVPCVVVGLAALLCLLVGVCAGGARADGLACPSVSQCTAVFYSSGLEVTFDPSAPAARTATTIDGSSSELRDVACPSSSQCTAVDGRGREFTFDPTAPGNPTPIVIVGSGELWTVACPAVSQCTASGANSVEATFNPNAPGAPAVAKIDGSGAVACPSALQCTVVTTDGREVTFTPTAPGTTTAVSVDPPRFCGGHCPEGYVGAVACPSSAQCTVVDNAGREVTFDPKEPGTPTPTYVQESWVQGGNNALACPSIVQCTAVGPSGEVTFNPNAPGTPRPTPINNPPDHELINIACPSLSQCTALDAAGNVMTFDPHAPGSATSASLKDGGIFPPPTTGLSGMSSGTAQAAGSARVMRGFAAIKLTCGGSGACKGGIELLARATGRRIVHRHGKRRVVGYTHTVVIGRGTFSIGSGKTAIVRVRLSRQGAALVRMHPKRGLTIKIGGTDVKTRSLVLK